MGEGRGMAEDYGLLPRQGLDNRTDFCLTLESDCMEPFFRKTA